MLRTLSVSELAGLVCTLGQSTTTVGSSEEVQAECVTSIVNVAELTTKSWKGAINAFIRSLGGCIVDKHPENLGRR